MHNRGKVAENLLSGARALAPAVIGLMSLLPGRIGLLMNRVDSKAVDDAAKLAGDKLKEANAEALAKRDYMAATLTRFRMDLDEGEDEQILLRSLR